MPRRSGSRPVCNGAGFNPASAQLEPGANSRGPAVRPAPAQRLRPRRRRRREGTHLPGLVYLAALNAIASERPGPVDAGLQVAIYDALWFLVPLASLVLEVVRPGAARAYLDAATASARRHEHALLVWGSLGLGGYLVVKGTTRLLT